MNSYLHETINNTVVLDFFLACLPDALVAWILNYSLSVSLSLRVEAHININMVNEERHR